MIGQQSGGSTATGELATEAEHRIRDFWRDMHEQNWQALPAYFAPEAAVTWPNTGERFTVAAFVQVNAAYPGDWVIELERLYVSGSTVITAIRASMADGASFHACSFFQMEDSLIARLEEYWGDDGPPPAWRTELFDPHHFQTLRGGVSP
jgi:ketosteroid isomerase-like protein